MHNPNVPETLEGWSLLHHMFRVRWSSLRDLSPSARAELAAEAAAAIAPPNPEAGQSTTVHLLGHKADLMVIHFRRSFEDLSRAQLLFQKTKLNDHLEMTTSPRANAFRRGRRARIELHGEIGHGSGKVPDVLFHGRYVVGPIPMCPTRD